MLTADGTQAQDQMQLTSDMFKDRGMRSGNLVHWLPHFQVSGIHLENSFVCRF